MGYLLQMCNNVLYFHVIFSFQFGINQLVPSFDLLNGFNLKYLVSFLGFMKLAIDSVDSDMPW